MTEIAGRLGKSQQAISQVANRLENLGYLERRVGSGRAVALHATQAGRDASAEGVARELAAEQRVRELLRPQQFDTLMTLLAATRDTLRNERS